MTLPRPVYIAWRTIEMVGQIVSRLVNAIVFQGSTRQTVSARAHIEQWPRGRVWINAAFGIFGVEDHCGGAWNSEVSDAIKTLQRNDVFTGMASDNQGQNTVDLRFKGTM